MRKVPAATAYLEALNPEQHAMNCSKDDLAGEDVRPQASRQDESDGSPGDLGAQ